MYREKLQRKEENDYDEKDARQATIFKEEWNEIAFSDFPFFEKIDRKRHFLKLQKKKKIILQSQSDATSCILKSIFFLSFIY